MKPIFVLMIFLFLQSLFAVPNALAQIGPVGPQTGPASSSSGGKKTPVNLPYKPSTDASSRKTPQKKRYVPKPKKEPIIIPFIASKIPEMQGAPDPENIQNANN